MKVFNKDKALRQIKLKQNKNTYIKKVSIVLSCFILLIGVMYFTFAKFEQNSEEYTLINGKIKYLGGDINIVSYNYDGNVNSQPPNKNEGYILTNINCENATGEWDDLNWELNLSSLTNKVKCNLEFDKNSNYQIIKYNPNGGYLEEQYKKGVVGQQIGELPTPVRTGYTFDGWYKEETYTNKVETTTTIDSTITNLYAKYTENTITINTLGESNVLNYAKANFELPINTGDLLNKYMETSRTYVDNNSAGWQTLYANGRKTYSTSASGILMNVNYAGGKYTFDIKQDCRLVILDFATSKVIFDEEVSSGYQYVISYTDYKEVIAIEL